MITKKEKLIKKFHHKIRWIVCKGGRGCGVFFIIRVQGYPDGIFIIFVFYIFRCFFLDFPN